MKATPTETPTWRTGTLVAAILATVMLLGAPTTAQAQLNPKDSQAVSAVAEKSLTSVVHISTATNVRGSSPWGAPWGTRPQGLGSGVIVSRDGLILTNNHVIESADEIIVSLSDGQKFKAKVVGTDPKSDLAVLRLQDSPKNLKAMRFGDSSKLRLGEFVMAIGNPFGLSGSVTLGIVSAKGRANIGIVDYEDFIQTDAAINPGNSGGALVNMRGELVGINTAILSRSGGYQGIGFSIPTNMVKPIMDSLVKNGRVRRGWLGVVITDVTPDVSKRLGMKRTKGVMIRDVQPGSPAAKAGLKRGDVVLTITGAEVNTSSRLRNLVALAGADESVTFRIFREGAVSEVKVRLGELPDK